MTFVCTQKSPLDGSVIYPGKYDAVRLVGGDWVLFSREGNRIGWSATTQQAIACGYFVREVY